jgi:hypothetical protein
MTFKILGVLLHVSSLPGRMDGVLGSLPFNSWISYRHRTKLCRFYR